VQGVSCALQSSTLRRGYIRRCGGVSYARRDMNSFSSEARALASSQSRRVGVLTTVTGGAGKSCVVSAILDAPLIALLTKSDTPD
jgi:hypothetical protein